MPRRRLTAAQREERAQMLAADPTIAAHGRLYTYDAWGCRCPECKEAKSQYSTRQAAARKERLSLGLVKIPHGTPSGYRNWGCRCEACSTTNQRYKQKRVENLLKDKREGGCAEGPCRLPKTCWRYDVCFIWGPVTATPTPDVSPGPPDHPQSTRDASGTL